MQQHRLHQWCAKAYEKCTDLLNVETSVMKFSDTKIGSVASFTYIFTKL